MAFNIVQEAHDFAYVASANPTITTSGSVTKGNLLVIYCTTSTNSPYLMPDDGRNTWIPLFTTPLHGGYGYEQAFYCIAESTRALTIIFFGVNEAGGTGAYFQAAQVILASAAMQFVEISGCSMNPFNITANATGTSTAPAASVATTVANTIVLGFGLPDTTVDTLTPGAGWTALAGGVNGSGIYATETSTGTYTPTFAQGTSASWGCTAVAFAAPGTTHTIAGALGASGANAKVLFTSQTTLAIYSATADGSGNYISPALENDTYLIQPQKVGVVFIPNVISATISGANVTGQNFSSQTVPTTIYLSTTASDTMQRANENPLSDGGNWAFNGADPQMAIVNNECVMSNAAVGAGTTFPSPFSGDGVSVWVGPGVPPFNQFMQFQVDGVNSTPLSHAHWFVSPRSNAGNSNAYFLGGNNNGDGTCNLTVFYISHPYLPVAGNSGLRGYGESPYALLNLSNVAFSLGDTFGLACISDILYVLHNGTVIGTVWDANVTAANSSSSLLCIVVTGNATTDVKLSNFTAGIAAVEPLTSAYVRQTTYSATNPASTTVASVSAPAINTAAGSAIVVAVRYGGSSTVTVTDSNVSNVYTPGSIFSTNGDTFLQFFYCLNANAQSANAIKAAFSPSEPFVAIHVWEVANVLALDKQAGGASANSPAISSAFTTTHANEIILAMATGRAITLTFFSGDGSFVDLNQSSTTFGVMFTGVQHKVVNSIQSGATSSMSWGTADAGVIAVIAFQGTTPPGSGGNWLGISLLSAKRRGGR